MSGTTSASTKQFTEMEPLHWRVETSLWRRTHVQCISGCCEWQHNQPFVCSFVFSWPEEGFETQGKATKTLHALAPGRRKRGDRANQCNCAGGDMRVLASPFFDQKPPTSVGDAKRCLGRIQRGGGARGPLRTFTAAEEDTAGRAPIPARGCALQSHLRSLHDEFGLNASIPTVLGKASPF